MQLKRLLLKIFSERNLGNISDHRWRLETWMEMVWTIFWLERLFDLTTSWDSIMAVSMCFMAIPYGEIVFVLWNFSRKYVLFQRKMGYHSKNRMDGTVSGGQFGLAIMVLGNLDNYRFAGKRLLFFNECKKCKPEFLRLLFKMRRKCYCYRSCYIGSQRGNFGSCLHLHIW